MTTSIKITELTSIGTAIDQTTLVPVVNMTGTPETQKATVQLIGNVILDGAGGSYFSAAAQAINAQTVSNAAQPAITSVGTLTDLTIAGTLSVPKISNSTYLKVAVYEDETERDASIPLPERGMIIFNVYVNAFQGYDGAVWQSFMPYP